MAYRNLFFVALVAGGVLAVGCSGGEGRFVPAEDDNDGAPYADGDQAAESADQPPGNDDQPPVNEDRPPGNPDQPPSGGPIGGDPGNGDGVCDTVCDQIDEECEGGQGQNPLRQLCSSGCSVPDGATAVPCLSQLAAALNCGVGAGGLCPTADDTETLQQQCQSQLQAFIVCRQAAEPPDDNDPQPGEGNCSPAGGCQNCGNECTTCICEANGDATEAAACAMTDACMP